MQCARFTSHMFAHPIRSVRLARRSVSTRSRPASRSTRRPYPTHASADATVTRAGPHPCHESRGLPRMVHSVPCAAFSRGLASATRNLERRLLGLVLLALLLQEFLDLLLALLLVLLGLRRQQRQLAVLGQGGRRGRRVVRQLELPVRVGVEERIELPAGQPERQAQSVCCATR